MSETKSFEILKQMFGNAFSDVKANRGSAGIDGQSITDFEKDVENNLYKLWNRMSSGSYIPPPVKVVEILKSDGGIRKLGIPTVGDRVAQMVAKMYLEPVVDPLFHENSYGYRPNKSAHQAVEMTKQRCWQYSWVIDMDIKGFFDNIDHELMMRAVKKHTTSKWLLLYIERWLKAPAQLADGTIVERDKGTPQGGVISPLLANIFLHHVFDEWISKIHPEVVFERYADDIIVHCHTLEAAITVKANIEKRLNQCKLQLHPEKTKIVFCRIDAKKGDYPIESFDFLGFTFQPRTAKKRRGKLFVSFLPAISQKANQRIRNTIREWKLHLRSGDTLKDIGMTINPQIKGWINYYGKFYKSKMYYILYQIDCSLIKWAQRKFRRFKGKKKQVEAWLKKVAIAAPQTIASWTFKPISKG